MSKVKITGNASGTGTLTIAAPNTNTDRTLTLPDEAGTVLTSASTLSSSTFDIKASDLRCVGTTGATTTMASIGTFYKCTWNSELIDNYNEFDTGNSRFVASETGTYEITIHTTCRLNYIADVYQNKLYKNGSAIDSAVYEQGVSDGNGQCNLMYTTVLSLNANDYIEQYASWTGTGTGRTANHYNTLCFFIVRKVG